MNSSLQIAQQIEHLRLNRDIQRRDRLVGDDESRVERERAGDADALSLAAAKLVWIAVQDIRIHADDLEQVAHTVVHLFGCAELEVLQRLRDDAPDRVTRVQRAKGVLEDHLHIGATLRGAGRAATWSDLRLRRRPSQRSA